MKILLTGARGFIGKNLTEALKNIDSIDGRAIDAIYEVDSSSEKEELNLACAECDFVFHFAGVNRPEDDREFMVGNHDSLAELLEMLKKHDNTCPIVYSSSIQASLIGKYDTSEYGRSKLAGEELLFSYAEEKGTDVLIYRFPNVFGKWCRPNYNSVVATFCHNIANEIPITINNEDTELELLYIDDLINEMFLAIKGAEHRCEFDGLNIVSTPKGKYCFVPVTHKTTLGAIAELLKTFHDLPDTLLMPELKNNSLAKKLYSTYISYLSAEKVKFPLKMNTDDRGSFTEVLKMLGGGQFSVNISKPGITKGQHWHHSKCEIFVVVSGHGLIQERKIGTDENGKPYPVIEFEVTGEKIEGVHMLPGYTHNIINLSDTEDLVTLMWANEQFDRSHPDTFVEPVIREVK